MTRILMAALLGWGILLGPLHLTATPAKAQIYTSDNKRIVRMGQSTSDYIEADGRFLTQIRFRAKDDYFGWSLVYGGRCDNTISKFKSIRCHGVSGIVGFQIIAPNTPGVEGEVEISGQASKKYITGIFTEREVQNAYYRYQTAPCHPDLFSVPKGSPGHVVEAKYVCTNDP